MVFKRIIKALWGLVLLPLYIKKFDPKLFDNKRVAIVGPADSVLNTNLGEYIDSFDYVVRMNKSPYVIKEGSHEKDIGKKLDVLFHCFYENEISGGGKLDLSLYDQLGIRYVVNPQFTLEGLRTIYNFYKKYLVRRNMYFLSPKISFNAKKIFYPHRPTTGFSAIHSVLNSKCSEVFITGFTFFRTAYTDGYRDSMKKALQAREHIEKANLHKPERELIEFKRLLKANTDKKILLDKALTSICTTTGITIGPGS